VRRKGQTPLVVMMTDGKANIGRDGQPGRAAADGDAQAAATAFRVAGTAALVLDIAPRSSEPACRLAAAMGAAYIALPYADAGAMSRAVLAARPTG
jgi:magnesium chelatase subunit D